MDKSLIRAAITVVVIAAAMFSLGCGKSAKKITVMAMTDVNTSAADPNPAPVSVRLYYLKASQRFSQADFETLYQSDSILAEDLAMETDERQIFPGAEFTIPFEPAKKSPVKYIGIVGLFREHGESGCWRKLVDLKSMKNTLTVRVSGNCVELGAAVKNVPEDSPSSEPASGPKKSEY